MSFLISLLFVAEINPFLWCMYIVFKFLISVWLLLIVYLYNLFLPQIREWTGGSEWLVGQAVAHHRKCHSALPWFTATNVWNSLIATLCHLLIFLSDTTLLVLAFHGLRASKNLCKSRLIYICISFGQCLVVAISLLYSNMA